MGSKLSATKAPTPESPATSKVPKETMSDQKRMNRALTQKYDMHQLRALQKLEQEFMDVICPIYGCDEDTLPVVVDLLKIFNEPASIRQSHLIELLNAAPSDVTAVIERVISEMARIDVEHAQHEEKDHHGK